MKIIVCIKQVPNTSEVKINPETKTLIRDGVESIINPDDKNALEAALRLKDEKGAQVVVLSMGPMQAKEALLEALAMGADSAYLISDRKFGGSDTWATATILAAAIEKIGSYDLIICGRQAIDGDTAQVGPQIAEHLGIPQVSYCEELKVEGDKFIVRRQFEDRYHIVEIKPPCLITTLSEEIDPRYMTVGGIFDAYQKEMKVWGLKDIEDKLDLSNIGLKGSPTNVKKSFTKQAKGKGVKLEGLTPEEAADAILAKLQEKYFI